MRVLFTTTPFLGHFHPLVPLARALDVAGHEVACACAESFHPAVRAAGLHAVLAGKSPIISAQHPRAEEVHTPREASIEFYLQQLVGFHTRAMLPDLIEICRQWEPDVIVREEAEFAGAMAAEHAGLPHATVQVLFPHGRSGLERAIARKLNRIRGEHGLPPDSNLEGLYRYLTISFAPPAFLRSLEGVPPTMHFLRPGESATTGGSTPIRWLQQDLRRPVIYATLGTAMSVAQALVPGMIPDVFPALIAGLRDLAGTLIVTVGAERDPGQYDPHLSHVHVERYVPNELLFPHCDLLVTHGGHNTVVPALTQGLPLVLIPFWADQPDNAQRCAELGVGQVIEPDDVTPERLQSVAQEVLHAPTYRRRAEAIREEMLALPPAVRGVPLLEELVRTKAPVVAAATFR